MEYRIRTIEDRYAPKPFGALLNKEAAADWAQSKKRRHL